jgi:hypothetical protein
MNDNWDENDRIGYGNPPVDTRFRKGRSGNPAARPRVSQSRAKLFGQALDARVKVRRNGRLVNMTKAEVIIHQAVNQAAQGDLRVIEFVFRTIGRVQPEPPSKKIPRSVEAKAKFIVGQLTRAVRSGEFKR